MSWFRIDDGFLDHPKFIGIRSVALQRTSTRAQATVLAKNAALAWVGAGLWGAGNNCDGIIPETAAATIAPRVFLTEDELYDAAEVLVAVGLWRKRAKTGKGAAAGPAWVVHDWKDYQPLKQQVRLREDREARKRALYKTVEGRAVVEEVKARDRDHCRYCWVEVRWNDRRSAQRGTIDHVDPDGPNSVANCVVACGSCNRRKSDRTLIEAEMILRDPYFGDQRQRASRARRNPTASDRDQVATEPRPNRTRGSGRVRSGQVGAGRGGAGRSPRRKTGAEQGADPPPHNDDDDREETD